MLLNGATIKTLGLIDNHAEGMFKAASYNLRIGKILSFDGQETTSYALPSLGMVEVISKEKVHLNKGIAGYATVKTSLCNDGILAINIGIIDPEYEGLISSTLINFGKKSYDLKEGDEFLRLTFHKYDAQETLPPLSARKPDSEYTTEKKLKALQHFSPTFLNIEEKTTQVTNAVAGKVLGEWKDAFFKWVPIAVAALAIFTFFLNWGNVALNDRYLKDALKSEITTELVREQQNKIENAPVEDRIAALEQKLRQLDESVKRLATQGTTKGDEAGPKKK